MIPFLPLNDITASYEPRLSEAVLRVVAGGWYLHGTEVKAFEAEFARYIGSACCVAVGNGLDALTLSLMALKSHYRWQDDNEVIVPDMTFIATAEAVVRAGLKPVLADVDEHAVLTPELAARVLTLRTRAVIPVHLYGYPAPMPELMAWAEEHGLQVVEDAAQAHGAAIAGKRVGSWGHLSAFSFYPGKNLGALGDGGAVVTNNAELAHTVSVLANYGAERKYYHTCLGLNSRLDEVQAAVLRLKLRRLDADNERRRQVAALYAANLSHPEVLLPYGGESRNSVFHIYPVRCAARHKLMQHLGRHGVETLIHYPLSLSAQPALQPLVSNRHIVTPEAQHWADCEISLPISPVITDAQVLEVCRAVNTFET